MASQKNNLPLGGQFASLLSNQRGSISVLTALTMVPVLIAATAAVDMGNAVRIKTSLQAAADAGVLAAATALASGYSDSDKEKIALDTFYANLSPQLQKAFPAEPDISIDFPAQKVHMAVQVNTDQLLTNFIVESMALGVQATAMVEQGSPVCLMALNPTAWMGLNIQGTANVQALDCAVHVNSNHDEGMRQTGGSQIAAESFCVHGDYSGSNYSPTPRRHCMREQDPLADKYATDLASTDLTTCREDNPKVVKGNAEFVTFEPGVYCGGLSLQQGKVRLAPGIHVFRDGELSVSAQSWLIGEGVSILLTGNASTRITNQAGANFDVSAPKTGPFAGIVIGQDPSTVPVKMNEIIGGGYMRFNGILYFPAQPLKITGNGEIGSDSPQFAIIADTITIEGNGVLTIKIGADYTSAGLPQLPEAKEVVRLVK
jgi:Flp pilus assembly protein TadG